MKKLFFTLLLQLAGILFLQAQFTSLHLSTGIVRSDLRSNQFAVDDNCNAAKTGFFAAVGTDLRVFKNFGLETNFVYQERKALEEFQVGMTFCKYPTSPQSEFYDPELYTHFPNFKYLNFEIMPTYRLGNRFQVSLGLGAFGGLLVNETETGIGEDDFAEDWRGFFEPPFNTTGKVYTVQYENRDYGWMGKLAVNYALSPRIRIGLSVKNYYSIADLEEWSNFTREKKWVADFAGIDFYYCFLSKE